MAQAWHEKRRSWPWRRRWRLEMKDTWILVSGHLSTARYPARRGQTAKICTLTLSPCGNCANTPGFSLTSRSIHKGLHQYLKAVVKRAGESVRVSFEQADTERRLSLPFTFCPSSLSCCASLNPVLFHLASKFNQFKIWCVSSLSRTPRVFSYLAFARVHIKSQADLLFGAWGSKWLRHITKTMLASQTSSGWLQMASSELVCFFQTEVKFI